MVGYDWSTIEGEYCLVHAARPRADQRNDADRQGVGHVHGPDLVDLKRDETNLEVRLDEPVKNAADVRALGIEVGDFVSLDPRVTVLENGYIKSRHLDDKACVAILLGVAKAVIEQEISLAAPSYLYVSNFEEVGHGSSAGLPEGTVELIAVDMAAVGEGQTSDEMATTVCVKDASGPYDYDLSRLLIDLARANDIDCRVDILPLLRVGCQPGVAGRVGRAGRLVGRASTLHTRLNGCIVIRWSRPLASCWPICSLAD